VINAHRPCGYWEELVRFRDSTGVGPLGEVLAIAKSVSNSRTRTVVAAGEAGRRLIVPVPVKGKIPGKLAPKLDVVGDVDIGVDSPGVGKRRQDIRADVEVGLVEAEEVYSGDNQSGCDLLVGGWQDLLLIGDVLPSNATIDADQGVISVFQVAAYAAAEGGLELNALL
jgi:hypothetical protein